MESDAILKTAVKGFLLEVDKMDDRDLKSRNPSNPAAVWRLNLQAQFQDFKTF